MSHSQNPPSDEDFPLSPEFKVPEEGASSSPQNEDILSSIPGVFDTQGSDTPEVAPPDSQSFSEYQTSPEASAQQEEPPAPEISAPPAEAYSEAIAENLSPTTDSPPYFQPADETLSKVKQFSANTGLAQAVVPAADPFSLLIEGRLNDYEREKLLDLISRENMGFREVDLEPQFESGKILIPRISEYAGVLLVQALRGASVSIRLGRSDTIFSTQDTQDETPSLGATDKTLQYCSADHGHPAEALPVTSNSEIAGFSPAVVIDVVVATAAIRTELVEAERSTEYLEMLEALNRELKYKAYRKGAQAIVNYSWNLMALSLPTHYRITVTGTALKKAHSTLLSLS